MEANEAAVRKHARKIFSRLGLGFFLFVAAAFAVQLAVIVIAGFFGNIAVFDDQNRQIVLSIISMYGIGFPVFWLVVRNMTTGYGDPDTFPEGGASFCQEGLEKERWGFLPILTAFVIAMGVMEAGNFIGNGLMNALSRKMGEESVNDVFTLIMDSNWFLIIFFAVILAPVMEELMFRKILIDRIIRFGELRAVIVSGVLFGVVHGNFYQFFYACGLGMIFAYIYVRTGKIWITMGLHMTINGMSSIIAGGLMKHMDYGRFLELSEAGDMNGLVMVVQEHWLAYLLLVLYGLGLMALAFVGIILLICVCAMGKIHFLPAAVRIPGRFTYAPVFFNVGMILFLVFCAAQFFIL